MNNKFYLDSLAELIVKEYLKKNVNCKIILPSHRSIFYLTRAIGDKIDVPVLLPEIGTIQDFIIGLSGDTLIGSQEAILNLYDIYLQSGGEDALSVFMDWAPELLSDFDDLDRNLVDPEFFFAYLNEIKAKELWDPGNSELTPAQLRYLGFWKSWREWYFKLKEKLIQEHKGYGGMAYRNAYTKISEGSSGISFILFAGLNALSLSEEKIISLLIKQNKAKIVLDEDAFYLKNTKMQAGRYQRKMHELWNEHCIRINNPESGYKNPNQKFYFHEVSGISGQAFLSGELVKHILENPENELLIVLNDSRVLNPLLNVLAATDLLSRTNVTMGFPLQETRIYELYKNISNALKRKEKVSRNELLYYYEDIYSCISNPLIRVLFPEFRTSEWNKVFQSLSQSSILSVSDIKEIFTGTNIHNGALTQMLTKEIHPEELPGLFQMLTEELLEKDESEFSGNERSAVSVFSEGIVTCVNLIRSFISESAVVWDIRSVCGFMDSFFSGVTIPFEPVKNPSIQIMGILETRTLGFEKVIILSCNEGMLPAKAKKSSFIPLDIRREFGMFTPGEREAVTAYHFYRLLQYTCETHLVYVSDSDAFGEGEKSRFLSQLQMALPEYNPYAGIYSMSHSITVTPIQERVIAIQKTPEVLAQLKKQLEYRLSFSKLSAYISCPLKFYYTAVKGIREPEVANEFAEANQLGTIIHSVLNTIYAPFINTDIDYSKIEQNYEKILSLVEAAFLKEKFSRQSLNKGLNFLLKHVCATLIQNQVIAEIRAKKSVAIVSLESALSLTLEIGNDIKVKLTGVADRIDSLNQGIRILDYKTGKVDDSKFSDIKLDKIFSDSSYDKPHQVMFYSFLYYSIYKRENIQAAIISLKDPNAPPLTFNEQSDFVVKLKEYQNKLEQLLLEIINPDIDFYQTKELKECENCAYKTICLR